MIPKKVSDVLFPNELYFTDLNPLHEEGQKGQICVFRRDTDRAQAPCWEAAYFWGPDVWVSQGEPDISSDPLFGKFI